MKNSRSRSRWHRKSSDPVLVELRRGGVSRLVRVHAALDVADADRVSACIGGLLLAGTRPCVELRMIQVEGVTPAAWVELLACSIRCRKHGAELVVLGMRAEVRRQLGHLWDWAALEAEKLYRWNERAVAAAQPRPESRGA